MWQAETWYPSLWIPQRRAVPRAKVNICGACEAKARITEALAISERFSRKILAVAPKAELTVIPEGFRIAQGSAKVAYGSTHRRVCPRGDAPTVYQAARTTSTVSQLANRSVIKGLAARGW